MEGQCKFAALSFGVCHCGGKGVVMRCKTGTSVIKTKNRKQTKPVTNKYINEVKANNSE